MNSDALYARIARDATDQEQAVLASVLGDRWTAGEVAVVLAYPGMGVGERLPALAGCTSQLLQVGLALPGFAQAGIGLSTLSTEDPQVRAAWAPAMQEVAHRVAPVDARALPHVEIDGTVYLTRTTWLRCGGSVTAYTDITDSGAHVLALLDHLVGVRGPQVS